MSTTAFSPMMPDDFEMFAMRKECYKPRTSSSISSSSADEEEWYLNKRFSRSRRISSSNHTLPNSLTNQSSQSAQPQNDKVTQLPPSLEVSLAILTSGLSVAAFHAVKGISDRRVARKLRSSRRQLMELSRAAEGSMLVPSCVVAQSSTTSIVMQSRAELVAELDGSPINEVPSCSIGRMGELVHEKD